MSDSKTPAACPPPHPISEVLTKSLHSPTLEPMPVYWVSERVCCIPIASVQHLFQVNLAPFSLIYCHFPSICGFWFLVELNFAVKRTAEAVSVLSCSRVKTTHEVVWHWCDVRRQRDAAGRSDVWGETVRHGSITLYVNINHDARSSSVSYAPHCARLVCLPVFTAQRRLCCRKCLSICVSVATRYCVKTAKYIVEILSLPSSDAIRVFYRTNLVHPQRSSEYRWAVTTTIFLSLR